MGRPWSKNEKDLLRRVQKAVIEKKRKNWPEALLVFKKLDSRPENGIEKVGGQLREYTDRSIQLLWRKMSAEESRGKARDLNNAISRNWKKNAVDEEKKFDKEADLAMNKKRKKSAEDNVPPSIDEGKKSAKEAGSAKTRTRKKSVRNKVSNVDANKEARE